MIKTHKIKYDTSAYPFRPLIKEILGENSFGKGSVQSIIPLKNKGAIRLTVAKYYLPSGKSISEVGVTPDILVEEVGNDFKIDSEKDNQLNYAIKLFNS